MNNLGFGVRLRFLVASSMFGLVFCLALGLTSAGLATSASAAGPGVSQATIATWTAKGFQFYEQDKNATAAFWFRKAALLGEPSAAYNLAVMYFGGEAKNITEKQALQFVEQSAGKGFALAQHMLGTFYEQGKHVPASQAKAFALFEKAALNNHTDAFVSVATQYYLGRGVAVNYDLAAQWYEKAAEKGDVGSQYLIASMYETGTGVKQNVQSALDWYSAAARQGDFVAKEKAKFLADQLATQKSS